MRSDRLVSLMLLLQARNPRSARELAGLLEVSMRTIYRDVDALSAAGVPVYAERGSAGGIALADGYRQAIAQFSTDELHALFVAAADPLADLGVSGHTRALHKLAGALPELQRRAAQDVRDRVLLDHNKWYRAQQPTPLLAVLRRAVWDDRRLRMRYRDRAGTQTERVVEPLGLVSKAGVWYLVAREPGGELRTFRAERIAAADELAEHFTRPADFDLERHWRSSTSAVERPLTTYEATLRVRADAVPSLTAAWDTELIAEDAETATFRVRFPGREAAIHQIVALGERARLVEPEELCEAAIAHARAFLRTHAPNDDEVVASAEDKLSVHVRTHPR
ncbi:MAG TPA: YafY family protein [Candidatus Limnocylindria bacterium]|nr:YafY family protein [Candidatus Limnocylindria bacterium]